MFLLQHQNANGQSISVTSTATKLFDLINTAAGTSLERAGFNFSANGLNITPEDGDVRVSFAEGIDPTASLGEILSQGVTYYLRNIPLNKMKLIRVGSSDVACSVVVGKCDPDEQTSAVATSVSLEASGTTDVQGVDASDAAMTARPVAIGGRAYDVGAFPSDVDQDGDAVYAIFSKKGELYVYNSRGVAGEDFTQDVQYTHEKAVSSSTGAYDVAMTTALASNLVAMDAAGRFYKAYGKIDSTYASATYFILFINETSLPSNGAVDDVVNAIPVVHTTGTDTPWSINLDPKGVYCDTGLVIALSTSEYTLTIGSAKLSATSFCKKS